MILRKIASGLMVLALLSCASIAEADNASPDAGGECAYKKYEGRALITAITPRSYPNNDTYEVKFLFYSIQEVTEPFAKFGGRELVMSTGKGGYPGQSYIRRNGIEAGKEFDCVLEVIVKGTCTPTIFEFPAFSD